MTGDRRPGAPGGPGAACVCELEGGVTDVPDSCLASRTEASRARLELTALPLAGSARLLSAAGGQRVTIETLHGTTADELWSWLIARDPGYPELERLLDAGWPLRGAPKRQRIGRLH